jgi:hypothetical protein
LLDNTYCILNPSEKDHYATLLVNEINLFLKKIYSKMERKKALKPLRIAKENVVLKTVSATSTKAWEFRLNSKEQVAKGDIGEIIVATGGMKTRTVRRQRALLIAAELYTYHAFANHPDKSRFRGIKSQNQYFDVIKKVFGRKSAMEARDDAIRYIIEDIGEHKLAHFSGHGWHTRIGKLKAHDPGLASALGASEKTFREILKKQHQVFTADMIQEEEDLVRHEIEEIDDIITRLEDHKKRGHTKEYQRLILAHLITLNDFYKSLVSIMDDLEHWKKADLEEHTLLKKRLVSGKEVTDMIKAEAEAETIDINKIHILFEHFEKEKINILRDLEVLDNKTFGSK